MNILTLWLGCVDKRGLFECGIGMGSELDVEVDMGG